MQFRFTLNNSLAGSHSIDEPDGWKGIKIKLERHPEYQSLIEVIDTPFFFYNIGQGKDGGREYLYAIEQAQGINATVTILVELTEDGATWDRVFFGNLDLSTLTDVMKGGKFYKFQCNIIQSDLWSKFQNRKSTSVNLTSTTDLDGDSVAAASVLNLTMPYQKIRQFYNANLSEDVAFDDLPAGEYIQFDLDTEVIQEINEKFQIPIDINPEIPVNLWSMEFGGDFTALGFRYTFSVGNIGSYIGLGGVASHMDLFFRVTTAEGVITDYPFVETDFADRSEYTLSMPISFLRKGDQITLYGNALTAFTFAIGNHLTIRGGPDMVLSNYSQAYIEYNTIYPYTETDFILIHNVADAIIKRTTQVGVYSELLGGSAQGYPDNGCAYLYALMLGLHVRGYSMTDKIFAMSFEDFWNGANPIFNLGIGPELVGGVEKIRIESKDYFFNDTPILFFDDVEGIERSYDQDKIIKSVKFGYSNWSAESASGIDDPQTNHDYSTLYKTAGVPVPKLSTFFAASLGIEQTRRNRIEIGKDWKLDNDIIIIATESSHTFPEVGSPFTSVTNIFNPTDRINLRITPYRNLKRWINFLSAGFQKYLSSPLKFETGEGNYKMAVGANSDTCDTGTWSEDQDVAVVATPNTTHEMRFLPKTDLTWTNYKLLRANRHQCIAVKELGAYKNVHIKLLEYEIAAAKADIKGWIK